MDHPARHPGTHRTGFTLLELALALSILAILVGLTWPVMMRFVGEQGLKEDVETVRADASVVRSLSIAGGLTFQFRYEPGGNRYVVLPYERPLSSGLSNEDSFSSPTIDQRLRVRSYELHASHRFESTAPSPLSTASRPSVTEQLTQEWLELFGGDTALAQVHWSPPILFKADGSASDAAFFVVDDDGRYRRITVRGLTAAVSAGPLQREDRR